MRLEFGAHCWHLLKYSFLSKVMPIEWIWLNWALSGDCIAHEEKLYYYMSGSWGEASYLRFLYWKGVWDSIMYFSYMSSQFDALNKQSCSFLFSFVSYCGSMKATYFLPTFIYYIAHNKKSPKKGIIRFPSSDDNFVRIHNIAIIQLQRINVQRLGLGVF